MRLVKSISMSLGLLTPRPVKFPFENVTQTCRRSFPCQADWTQSKEPWTQRAVEKKQHNHALIRFGPSLALASDARICGRGSDM